MLYKWWINCLLMLNKWLIVCSYYKVLPTNLICLLILLVYVYYFYCYFTLHTFSTYAVLLQMLWQYGFRHSSETHYKLNIKKKTGRQKDRENKTCQEWGNFGEGPQIWWKTHLRLLKGMCFTPLLFYNELSEF